MDREQYLRMQLSELEASYRRDAKPIIDELVRIQASKPVYFDPASLVALSVIDGHQSPFGQRSAATELSNVSYRQ